MVRGDLGKWLPLNYISTMRLLVEEEATYPPGLLVDPLRK